MPYRLRDARWTKVDFVDRGADEHARLLVWKRDNPVPNEKEAVVADPINEASTEEPIDEATTPVEKSDVADVPSANETPDSVSKADYEALIKRLAEAEETIAKREEAIAKREWADRLAKFDGVLPEDAVDHFVALDATAPDLAKGLLGMLDGLREQVDMSALYAEAGNNSTTEGSAEAEIDKRANALAAETGQDYSEAYAEVLKRDPALYARYKQEA